MPRQRQIRAIRDPTSSLGSPRVLPVELRPRMTVNRARVVSRTLVFFGAVALLAGVALVVKGEIERARGDARFRAAQTALKEGVEIFDQSPIEDATKDRAKNPGATTSSPSRIGADVPSAIARVQIEGIGVDVATVRYNTMEDLEIGLGWMPESAAPGEPGTSIVVGHRTLFGAPLVRADEIAVGDEISVGNAAGVVSVYVVRGTYIRRPSDTFADLIASSDTTRLLLVTCHPEHSTEFRLLVVADVVEQE